MEIKPVNIQGVTVPNPDALKFETDGFDLGAQFFEFDSLESAKASPLAYKLFRLGYVTRVFLAGNFITVTKKGEDGPSWQEAYGDIRILIKRHLENQEPLFTAAAKPLDISAPQGEHPVQLHRMLGEVIAPATLSDGGLMTYHSYENGVMHVSLHGACAGCPFAPRTIKSGIEVLAQKEFPWLKEVTSHDVAWEETQQA